MFRRYNSPVQIFLSFYIGNAPKYAIDSILNDGLQACCGFIAMPVFVIGLLNNFIFNPMISRMSFMWSEKELPIIVCKPGFANKYTADNQRIIKEIGNIKLTDYERSIKFLYEYYLERKAELDIMSLVYQG